MAERELEIGRYYMSRGNHVGAINRFKVVVKRFRRSSAAIRRSSGLSQVYLTIGIRNEAQAGSSSAQSQISGKPRRSDALDILTKAGLEPAED